MYNILRAWRLIIGWTPHQSASNDPRGKARRLSSARWSWKH